MSAMEKSDLPEVARKRANKAASAAAEPVERRGGAKENAELQSTVRTQSREAVSRAQARIREAVTRNRQDKLTALLHHVNIEILRAGFFGLRKTAAPGVDPEKTRLIEFGRNAIANRRTRGLGKPETFDFLGFKHYCATRRDGSGFVLGRKPMAKRMRTKLREIKERLMATRHDGIDGQGKWLAQVLRGWMAYYAVPMSGSAISAFRHHMIERWHGALMRRSQRRRLTWTRMKTIADRYLPFPRILHPWPEKRFLVTIQGGSPVR